MKKKLNIAYIPKKNLDKFYNLLIKRENTHNYYIGKLSIPHITICQFYSELDEAENIWSDICNLDIEKEMSFSFKEFSDITFDGLLFWRSIIPSEYPDLLKTYEKISKLVSSIRKDAYDPHLTLFNYLPEKLKDESFINEVIIQEDFELVLGDSDEIGQLTSTIFTKENFHNSFLFSGKF